MRLVVHIGTEKTGTSSIQSTLHNNRILLLEKGYYFTRSAGEQNNLLFPLSCMNLDRGDPYFRNNNISSLEDRENFLNSVVASFYDEISDIQKKHNIHTVIISSEHFHSLLINQEEVHKFKKLFCEKFNKVDIFCYLREQVSTCVSHYSTVIKSGLSPELNEFIKNCTPENPYYNYLNLLNRWSNAFGKENIKVGFFNKTQLKNQNIVDDFIYKLDTELEIERTNEKANQSLNYIGQCLLKKINSDKNITNISLVREIHKLYSGKGEDLDQTTYSKHFHLFEHSNRELNKNYFNKNSNLFDHSPPNSTNVINNANEIIEEIYPIISFLSKKTFIPEKYADICRDTAIEYEKSNIEKSLNLMELALFIRPHGGLIKKKVREYKNKNEEIK